MIYHINSKWQFKGIAKSVVLVLKTSCLLDVMIIKIILKNSIDYEFSGVKGT